jgi:hypothetical protein
MFEFHGPQCNRAIRLKASPARPVRVKGGCGRQSDGTAGLPQLRKNPVRSNTYASCHKLTSYGA